MIYAEPDSDLPPVVPLVSHSQLTPAASLPKANSLVVTTKPRSAIWGETASSQDLVLSCADFCSDFQ